MKTIRIPEAEWGKVWRVLVASGPITRLSQDPVYLVSERKFVCCAARNYRSNWFQTRTARNRPNPMARSARRYDLYLPLTDNAGRILPDDLFDELERRLLVRFGASLPTNDSFPSAVFGRVTPVSTWIKSSS